MILGIFILLILPVFFVFELAAQLVQSLVEAFLGW
jgi:hypothetical protein